MLCTVMWEISSAMTSKRPPPEREINSPPKAASGCPCGGETKKSATDEYSLPTPTHHGMHYFGGSYAAAAA